MAFQFLPLHYQIHCMARNEPTQRILVFALWEAISEACAGKVAVRLRGTRSTAARGRKRTAEQ